MKTKTLAVLVAAAISTATCAAVTVAPTKEEALPPAVLADQFHPPFGTFVLNPAFIQAAKVTQITRSHDRLLEDGSLLSDFETFVYTFNPQGEPLSIVELLRGERFSSTENTYDGAGRLSQSVRSVEERLPIAQTFTYDAQSRLVTVEESGALSSKTHHHYERGRLSRRVFAGSGEEAVETFTYDDKGRVVSKTLLLPNQKTMETQMVYGSEDEPLKWTVDAPTGRRDHYHFTHSSKGLSSLLFVENQSKIYRRSFEYDAAGFLRTERLESFVPAMGSDIIRYEYELEGGWTLYRQPPREVPRPPENREYLEAAFAAFPEAYEELATVSFENMGSGNPTLQKITLLVPEKELAEMSKESLKARACEVRKSLGHECDCEYVELKAARDYAWHSWPEKRVVPVVIHLMFGC